MFSRISFENKVINDYEVVQLADFSKEKFISLAKHFKNIIPSQSFSKFQNELDIFEYC